MTPLRTSKAVTEIAAERPPTLICRTCHQAAQHNPVLRISFCSIHGLSGPLDEIGGAPGRSVLRTTNYVRTERQDFIASWAIPAG